MLNGEHAAIFRGLVEYALSPFFLLFLVLFGVILYLLWPGCERAARRAGLVLAVLWCGLYTVSTAWVPNAMIKQLESHYSRIKQVNPNIHWVVVLGGGAAENLEVPASDALSGPSLKRVLEGVRLYRKLPEAKLILSGAGRAKPGFTVAERFAEFTDWMPVPKAHRILEADSINTADEARWIQPLVGEAPFYLVTSALHMPRAMMLFEKQGLHPVAAPSDYLLIEQAAREPWRHGMPTLGHLILFNIAWHEYLGMLWGKLRGKI